MNGPFKMKPGRGDMPKTGRDIPTSMVNPIMQTTDPRSGFVAPDIDPKSGFERYQKKKVGRDAVRKRDIMDSDVGKDAFKKVAKKAKGLSGSDISAKRVLVHLKPNYQQLVKLKLTMEIRFQIPLKPTIMDKLKVLKAVVELNKH